MMKTINAPVSVEARFDEEGTVTPTAFSRQGRTYPISDVGRRWTETNGPCLLYHCLVMTPTGETFELCLDTSILQWRIVRAWQRPKVVWYSPRAQDFQSLPDFGSLNRLQPEN